MQAFIVSECERQESFPMLLSSRIRRHGALAGAQHCSSIVCTGSTTASSMTLVVLEAVIATVRKPELLIQYPSSPLLSLCSGIFVLLAGSSRASEHYTRRL